MGRKCFLRAVIGLTAGLMLYYSTSASAKGYAGMYPASMISADAIRLETAVRRIYNAGVKPYLTLAESKSIGRIHLEFPLPTQDSDLFTFYVVRTPDESVVKMPILSLKQVEDLTTAFAWLYIKKYNLTAIDLYFAMLRHKPITDFPQARYPNILSSLGVPKDVLKHPDIDKLSLALRNEAFAFILLHELGHVYFKHRAYSDVIVENARKGELQADWFALEVLTRSETPPLGAAIFFRAVAHVMPRRGEFASESAWKGFLRKVATHPQSSERISLMADVMSGPSVKWRYPERAHTWRNYANLFRGTVRVLDNVELQRCIARAAMKTDLTDVSSIWIKAAGGIC